MIIAVIDADALRSRISPQRVTLRTVLGQAFEYADDPFGPGLGVDPDTDADFADIRRQLEGRSPLVLTDSQFAMTRNVLLNVAAETAPHEEPGGELFLVARYGEELAEALATDDSRHICRTRA